MLTLGFLHKLDNIVEGWINYHFPNEEIEHMALLRANECAKCPHAESSTWHEIIEHRPIEMSGMVCGMCKGKCPITKLVRAENAECSDNPKRW